MGCSTTNSASLAIFFCFVKIYYGFVGLPIQLIAVFPKVHTKNWDWFGLLTLCQCRSEPNFSLNFLWNLICLTNQRATALKYSISHLHYFTVLSPNKLTTTETETKPYLLSYQHHCDMKYVNILSRYSKNLVIQVPGHLSQYKKILPLATFCLVTLPATPVTLLTDCLAAGSIPVILCPSPPSLPFSQVNNWQAFSLPVVGQKQVGIKTRPNDWRLLPCCKSL